MQKRFQELKRQLAELSETINKFESEAVQLRIVELVFDQTRGGVNFFEADGENYEPEPSRGRRSNGVEKRPASSLGRPRSGGGLPSASGAVAALVKLVEGNFFNEKRTIGDIVKQCQEEFGALYKSNAFSGPLSRLAMKGILKREKNGDGIFVYYK